MKETKPCGTCGLATMCIGEDIEYFKHQLTLCRYCGDIFWLKRVLSSVIPGAVEFILRANLDNVCHELRDSLEMSAFYYADTHTQCTKLVCRDAASKAWLERQRPGRKELP